MPAYIDGRAPVSVSTLEASIGIQTPYIQQGVGASVLGVPDPAADDNFVVLSGVQTLSSKTLLQPVITTGVLSSPTIYEPSITSGSITSGYVNTSLITTPDIRMTGGGTLTGGIMHNVIGGLRVVTTGGAGATKTLNLSTADVFIVNLTQNCTLTVSNVQTGKIYQVVVKQTSTNYFQMSWMTGFINGVIASGPTQYSGAIDAWVVLFDGSNHIGWGAKDIQS